MKKYRIVEKRYDNNTSSFQAQYFIGEKELEFSKECGFSSDGWINISSPKDTYRKALLKLNGYKKGKMRLIRVMLTINVIETIIHNVVDTNIN
jgi:hypothetical protein